MRLLPALVLSISLAFPVFAVAQRRAVSSLGRLETVNGVVQRLYDRDVVWSPCFAKRPLDQPHMPRVVLDQQHAHRTARVLVVGGVCVLISQTPRVQGITHGKSFSKAFAESARRNMA